VEEAGLAGPRRAGEQEEPGLVEAVEVDVLGVAERAEGPDPQVVQAHQPAARSVPPAANGSASSAMRHESQASWSRSSSSVVASRSRTSWTNPRATSRSLRPTTRGVTSPARGARP